MAEAPRLYTAHPPPPPLLTQQMPISTPISDSGDTIIMTKPSSEQTKTESPLHLSVAADSAAATAATVAADNESTCEPKSQQAENIRSAPSGPVPLVRATLSQPMTASTSSPSSNPPVKDTTTGVAPYGTRSRNRAGISRPNYAEDREIDMDFEAQTLANDDDRRKTPRSSDAHRNTLDTSGSGGTSRRAGGSLSDVNGATQLMPKDHIPGTSTFSANPAGTASAQPSKKRKAMGQSTSRTANANHPAAATAGVMTISKSNLLPQNPPSYKESFMLSFECCGAHIRHGKLVADDGTVLGINDHVYLVCEPPGEPYYLGRIMEFLHVNNDPQQPVDALRMNWYYRPKDIGRKANDTRQVFASMHSDISPLTSLRGLCQIKHKSEIENMDEYRRTQNCFWYEKLFDRYIHRYYEVIATKEVINVPAKVKKVLDDRWKFILVEPGRGKELTRAKKSCKRCAEFCASDKSVDCAVCRQTYHMNCVRPPLLKKPSRGFAWACGPCSRAQERKLEARNAPNIADAGHDAEEEEAMDEDDEDLLLHDAEGNTGCATPIGSVEEDLAIHPGTEEQIYQASLWPFRYLGIHCKVEDALDYDDRIYPRASSRLGPRHQANVPSWPGRPVELVKTLEIKKKYMKGGSHKKDAKLSKETVAALEADKLAREKRPKWVMDEPRGYVHRGEDHDIGDPNCTAELLFKPAESDDISENHESTFNDYLKRSAESAKQIGVREYSVNFLDKAVALLYSAKYDAEKALKELSKVEKKDLKEPELTPAEIKKFEDGVAKFGSELHSVKKHVKTVSAADIVRFYYIWKKTERGKQIWDNYAGRKGKKEAKKLEVNVGKLQDDVADDYDDSAFDNDKALEKKRGFQCKFCSTRTSRQWRRAPNTPAGTTVAADPSNKGSSKDKGAQLMVALCLNCAVVWRKYAVQWEDTDDHGKKASQGSSRSSKRKAEDPLREFQLSELSWPAPNTDAVNTPSGGTPAPQGPIPAFVQEAPRKKAKSNVEKGQVATAPSEAGSVIAPPQQKKKASEKPAASALVLEMPKPKILPCSICLQIEPMEQHLSCKECRMAVHRNCYGVVTETRGLSKWVCDMCSNDRSPQVSIQYKCMLCPIEITPQDFVEPAKVSHKKKSEKEREKDRMERELAIKTADFYRKKQEEMNRPIVPREPLKRTANNNWVHVTCAVWTPEVKFGNAKALEPSEGIPSVPSARYDEICKICKSKNGACVACLSCRAPVHVECAHQAGYVLGFDISPVKGSRRDHVNIVNINGEAGIMTAAIWCKDHSPTKTIVHHIHDIVDDNGLNALQLYVQNFKQADLTLTGTVRKATLVNQSTKIVNPSSSIATQNRRTSATAASNAGRGSISNIKMEDVASSHPAELLKPLTTPRSIANACATCGIDTSPKWWPFTTQPSSESMSSSTRQRLECHTVESEADLLKNQENANMRPDNPRQQVALAAAALSEESPNGSLQGDVQCHKCHWNKVQKHSRSPPIPTSNVQQDAVQPHQPTSVTATIPPSLPSPMVPSTHVQSTSHYPWTHSTFPQSTIYADWSRMSPVLQNSNITLRQYNGPNSPRGLQTTGQHINSQSQSRQSIPAIPRSPHTNGSLPPVTSTNGYPSSPHRSISGIHTMQHGSFVSYASTRPPPPPQHLTNGGPPPRASENPFSHGSHSSFRPAFGVSHSSPPIHRDGFHIGRETANHSNGGVGRAADHRVNGGASASPSLQNLLS